MIDKPYILEACIESLEEAKKAEVQGADRLELCSRLDLDGLTPSTDLIKEVISSVQIPVKVMIRHRDGDFVYNNEEIEFMAKTIKNISGLGIKEFVLGASKDDNTLHFDQIKYLSEVVSDSIITVHKAIDFTPDPVSEVAKLKTIKNVRYVLSSGASETAMGGQEVLRNMIKQAGNKITVIAAGRVTESNLTDVHAAINGQEYHGRKIVGNLD